MSDTTTSTATSSASASQAAAADLASLEVQRTLGREARGRWIRRIISLLVLAGAGVGGYMLYERSNRPPPPPTFSTVTADKGDVVTTVSATGTVQPVSTVDVGPEISGKVVEVLVDFNSTVEKGQILAKLDTEPLLARLEEAEARLEAAKASTRQALATVSETRKAEKRIKALKARSVASDAQLEGAVAARARASASYASARAQERLAEAQVKQVKTDIAKATIVSPIGGVVLSRAVEPGSVVAASFQTPVLFKIAEDLRKMELQLSVDEADVGKVRPGMKATFTVDAHPDVQFDGEVVLVHYAPTAESTVVTYETVLRVDNGKLLLRPGMTATATITSSAQRDVLRIPNAALRFTPPRPEGASSGRGGRMFGFGPPSRRGGRPSGAAGKRGPRVWVLRDGSPRPVRVELGETDGQMTEVKGGDLKIGDEVIVGLEQAKEAGK